MVLNYGIGQPPAPELLRPQLTVAADGTLVLAGLVATPPGLPGTGLPFTIQSSETIEAVDRAGTVTTKGRVSAPGYDLVDIEFDGGRGGLVLLYRASNQNGDVGAADQSLLVALDRDFVEAGRWSAPVGVTVKAIAPDQHGGVILAGTQHGSGADQVWLDALDVTTLREVWSQPHLDDGGAALAVDVTAAGEIVATGSSGDSSGTTLWVQRFDADGRPVLPSRLSTTVGQELDVYGASLAAQSDGSVFLVGGGSGFVYCP
jgi:hypothetical protein